MRLIAALFPVKVHRRVAAAIFPRGWRRVFALKTLLPRHVFTKNRERLLKGNIAQVFFHKVVEQARAKDLLSDEHFTVDGTLIEAWAGQKSFQRKDAPPPPPEDGGSNPTLNFHGEKRSNQTHQSTSDPEAMLYKKSRGSESKLSYLGHVLMENRNGLVVDTRLTRATGTAERDAALEMAARIPGGTRRVTLGGDKNYDTRDFVDKLREAAVTPHVAQNQHERRSSAIDQRTTQHPGYAISQRKRKRVEEIFGWIKTIGGLRKTKHRGKDRVGWMFTFAAGGLQSGSHEKPGASCRLRSPRGAVNALAGRKAGRRPTLQPPP